MKFKLRRYFLYYLGRALGFLLQLLPMGAALALAEVAGRAAYSILGSYRKITLDNLRQAFGGGKSDKELRDIAEFMKVRSDGYFVEWQCGADLSADTIEAKMYDIHCSV